MSHNLLPSLHDMFPAHDTVPASYNRDPGQNGWAPPSPPRTTNADSLDDEIHEPEYDNKRHVCTECGKRFARPSSLNLHINTHTGAQPFRCPLPSCGRTFNVKSNMRRHLRNHGSILRGPNRSSSNSPSSRATALPVLVSKKKATQSLSNSAPDPNAYPNSNSTPRPLAHNGIAASRLPLYGAGTKMQMYAYAAPSSHDPYGASGRAPYYPPMYASGSTAYPTAQPTPSTYAPPSLLPPLAHPSDPHSHWYGPAKSRTTEAGPGAREVEIQRRRIQMASEMDSVLGVELRPDSCMQTPRPADGSSSEVHTYPYRPFPQRASDAYGDHGESGAPESEGGEREIESRRIQMASEIDGVLGMGYCESDVRSERYATVW